MDDLTNILSSIYQTEQYQNDIKNENEIKVLEIGTGEGANSTKILYNFFQKHNKNFKIVSYEGMFELYSRANRLWSLTDNVFIMNEYFVKKNDINELLIPSLPDYIEDYRETNDRFKRKYKSVMTSNDNFFTSIDFVPDVIFVDSSRFMHLPIINLCYEISKTNPKTLFIMEEDYYIDGNYGELEIIQKHFNLRNVVKYKKGSWQWPFVSFNIQSKK